MAYGVTHTSTIPTVSTTVGPDYATQVNACLAEIRATLDAKVTPSGFQMASDFSFLDGVTYRAATNVERVNLQNKSATIAAATYPRSVFVANGELYYNDNSSRQIQLTNAGAVNVTTTGGITGTGYGASGVEVNWDSGANAYRLKSGSGANSYASVILDDVLLRDGSDHAWRLQSPALAADLNLTLPSAYPAATSLMTMGTTGTVALTRDPSVDTVTTSGNGTIGGTLGVTGLITATAGLTAGANQHVTISGTGRVKHGTRTRLISAFGMARETLIFDFAGNSGLSAVSGGQAACALPVHIGERVTRVYVRVRGSASETWTANLYSINASGTLNLLAGPEVSVLSTGNQTLTLTVAGAVAAVAGESYVIRIQASAADPDLLLVDAEMEYDHP